MPTPVLPTLFYHIIRGTVVKFVDCGFTASYYKVFTYIYTNPHRPPALLIRTPQMVTRRTQCSETRDMFRSSVGILWHVPWLIPTAAAISSTDWERLARTKVATSILRSFPTAHHPPNCLSPAQNVGAT
jgi:hypothetical protein